MKTTSSIYNTDVLVIGIGSAGFGAVRNALLGGASVIGIDVNPGPGGTSTFGGVNNWEPGISLNGVHSELARRLMERGDAFVGRTTEYVSSANRWATSDRSGDGYETTLRRFGVHPDDMRRFQYEPDAMAQVMQELMDEADTDGRLTLYYNSRFVDLTMDGAVITSCTVETPDGIIVIRPKLVIDCSADIVAARAAGCSYAVGEDSAAQYGEEAAPDVPASPPRLNGLTQCFRITHTGETVTEIPECYRDVDLSGWEDSMERYQPVSCFSVYPRGGIYVNMLPTGEGELFLQYPPEELKHICEARAYSYMRWLAKRYNFTGWQITRMFPMLGLRETYRLIGTYVLTRDDLHHGYASSLGKDHTIALADHPADTHGRGSAGCRETGRYGIPYECLLPRSGEADNLLVACRGSSFTHLAASSARLSRTMIQLGEAAGSAAALCIRDGCTPYEVNLTGLRKRIGADE
ncbi:MAG: FAD-dependent oxidoreductase [Clostridia bacterium]|nr:FAD-dependent oxidoreductase [Clostridia bacterium]